jgi:hypothetical protein
MENDRAFADLVNECLDAIECGEASVEECLARHPGHAEQLEGLLRLADEARELPVPALAPDRLAAGEERILQALRDRATERPAPRENQSLWAALSERWVKPVRARIAAWPRWALPALAASGGLALIFAFLVAVTLGAGATWWGVRNRTTGPERTVVIQSQSPIRTPVTEIVRQPEQTPEGQAVSEPTQAPEEGPAQVVFLPFLSVPLPSDQAMLRDVQGVVEVQAADGQTWSAAAARQIVQAGQRVRAGALSAAQIVFYDGSVARLGPESEISIDRLGQNPADETRIIELTQWAGESDHEVTPAYGSQARYEVHTPSGTGRALGTSFHVRVVPGSWSRFAVDRGAVAVVHLDVTVVVVAGQLTTVPVGQSPGDPVFRVTGEGEVTQVGTTWEIGGQVFATHEQTVLVGNPQVGDWVHVEGHLLPDGTRVADRIVLLRRAPENRFAIEGVVDALETDAGGSITSATVAGQAIVVGEETEVDDGIQVGDRVRVQGVIDEGGALLAASIHLVEPQGIPFEFVGVLEDNSEETWTISGASITVDAQTAIQEELVVGDLVRVRGVFVEQDGGVWLARSIHRVESQESEFEFVGLVEQIDPWVVSGIEIETRPWTEIQGEIALGDRVKVEGRLLPDGTWLADEIKPADEERGLGFEFVGTVQSVEPWVVGGIPLAVNAQTEIQDPISVGDWVKVEGQILPDGTWLADEIKPLDVPTGQGCMTFTALVVRVDAGQVVLQNGAAIPLDGTTAVEGPLQPNAVIQFYLCVDDEGNVTTVTVVVLYQIEPAPTVEPARPTRPPEQDDDDEDEHDGERKVTICHRAQGESGVRKTITVGWDAWINSHSKHGDTLGPCE